MKRLCTILHKVLYKWQRKYHLFCSIFFFLWTSAIEILWASVRASECRSWVFHLKLKNLKLLSWKSQRKPLCNHVGVPISFKLKIFQPHRENPKLFSILWNCRINKMWWTHSKFCTYSNCICIYAHICSLYIYAYMLTIHFTLHRRTNC